MPARKQSPATTPPPAENKRVPMRLTILVHVDPERWPADEPTEERPDAAKIAQALIAVGMSETSAASAAAAVVDAHDAKQAGGINATREAVRSYMLAALRELPKVTASEAIITDAYRDK
jgi:hypothetical protein